MQIHELHLETTDINGLQDFYKEILQLPVYTHDKKITIQVGRSQLVFTPATSGHPFYHFAFTIPANKIEEAKSWLENKVTLLWMEDYQSNIAEFVNWNARSVYFLDPAGNIVELIARQDLCNVSDISFSSDQIVAINEVGIVLPEDELEASVSQFIKSYGLCYFDKQPPLPQFKAVGNDEGLFIMVPFNRNWYPTSLRSAIFPMTIVFANQEKLYQLLLPGQVVH